MGCRRLIYVAAAALSGCVAFGPATPPESKSNPIEIQESKTDQPTQQTAPIANPSQGSKTLLEWKIGENDVRQEVQYSSAGANGTDSANGNNEAGEEQQRLQTDRPIFPEASSTVGAGRTILESGYTYSVNRSNGSPVNLQ